LKGDRAIVALGAAELVGAWLSAIGRIVGALVDCDAIVGLRMIKRLALGAGGAGRAATCGRSLLRSRSGSKQQR
jgi:hypothetical protein